jgi:membrane protein
MKKPHPHLLRTLVTLFKEAFQAWLKDEALRMGAALAFYTAFSLAPLLVLVVAVGGFLFNKSLIEDQIIFQMTTLMGRQGADMVHTLILAAHHPTSGILATLTGVLTLLIGATGALVELQDGLNRIWKVPESKNIWLPILTHRLLSLALILGIAFLLLVSLIISALFAAIGTFLSGRYPVNPLFWQGMDIAVSWCVITLLFAQIYKILPDALIRWNDVWIGAATASILFTVGKFLVGVYIVKSAMASTYGAAGSFVVLLVWVYYSSLLLYYGAEFTKVYADRFGSHTKL